MYVIQVKHKDHLQVYCVDEYKNKLPLSECKEELKKIGITISNHIAVMRLHVEYECKEEIKHSEGFVIGFYTQELEELFFEINEGTEEYCSAYNIEELNDLIFALNMIKPLIQNEGS